MTNEFVYCSKCGARNFANDKVCGICKAALFVNPPKENTSKISPKGYFLLIALVIGLVYIYYSASYKEPLSDSSSPTAEGIGYSDVSIPLKSQSTNAKYTILKIRVNQARGFNVDIRLQEKVSKDELIRISQSIKSEIKAKSDIGTIGFLLPEMVLDNGAWATVNFSPNINVIFLGPSLEQDQKIKSEIKKSGDDIGIWMDNQRSAEIAVRIRKDDSQGYVFEYVSPLDPQKSPLATPVIKKLKNGRVVFLDTEHTEQYYQIEKNGNLSVYDNYGLVCTFIRLIQEKSTR